MLNWDLDCRDDFLTQPVLGKRAMHGVSSHTLKRVKSDSIPESLAQLCKPFDRKRKRKQHTKQ